MLLDSSDMEAFHEPVMLRAAIDSLAVEKGKRYIDATLGGGGYTRAIADHGGRVLGIDLDRDAIDRSKRHYSSSSIQVVHGSFREISRIARTHAFLPVDGVVFDLGVSSFQLDTKEKGFSYRFDDADLDLRFDTNQGSGAADIVNTYTEDELYEIFAKYAEEPRARAIARALVSARKVKALQTTGDVARVVATVAGEKKRGTQVLSRVFQALRIVVNDELEALRDGLTGARTILAPRGRLVVVSYHSLEDRIVKQFMKTHMTPITKKPLRPHSVEVSRNRRARSAKLRCAQKP